MPNISIPLPGLHGTNPLGFFAALGVLRTLARTDDGARLCWEPAAQPTALVSSVASIAELVERVTDDLSAWRIAPVFDSREDVKLELEELREFLRDSMLDPERSGELAAAMSAEGVVDGKGNAKPTDFHFTAGQQRFLGMARTIRDAVTADDVEMALCGPWQYTGKTPSLMWDVSDDRVYALSALNPSTKAKETERGAEWLALLGLTAFPVVAGKDRTLTPGCAGSWKFGTFTWPLWRAPLGFQAVRSLIGSNRADDHSGIESLGCFLQLTSAIRRSEQGGYGTFGPPVVAWQQSVVGTPKADPFPD